MTIRNKLVPRFHSLCIICFLNIFLLHVHVMFHNYVNHIIGNKQLNEAHHSLCAGQFHTQFCEKSLSQFAA